VGVLSVPSCQLQNVVSRAAIMTVLCNSPSLGRAPGNWTAGRCSLTACLWMGLLC